MTRSLKPKLTLAQQFIDLTVLGIAFWIAAALASPGSIAMVSQSVIAREKHVFASLLILLVSWSAGLSTLWLSRDEPNVNWQDELIEVFKAVSLCMMILSAAELMLEWQTVNKWVLLNFWGLALVLLFSARLIKRLFVRQYGSKVKDRRRVVIVGAGARGQQTAEMINQKPELGYTLVGFVDDVEGSEMIGRLNQLEEILAANVIDEMIIALPIKTFYEEMENIIHVATEQGITVRVHSNLFTIPSGKAVAEQVGGTPMVSLYMGPRFNLWFLLKGVMDFFGAIILLILLAPVMILIAVLIKLTSRGPVLFTQERLGYNKRPFRMYKFRTMVADAESKQAALEQMNEASGPVFKIRNDPRVTSLG
ncbi:MAG TPA: sugar transferase, partial [Blastocatellia bacterium]|nr:sugar transferase [Blastocatellia bacterium]